MNSKVKEAEIIDRIDDDQGIFFRYSKAKSTIRSDIGPLRRPKYNIIVTKMSDIAEILAHQYKIVCTEPFKDLHNAL